MSGKNLVLLLLLLGVFTAVVVIAVKPRKSGPAPSPEPETGGSTKVISVSPGRFANAPPAPKDPWELLDWAVDYSPYGDEAVHAGGGLPGAKASRLLSKALARDDGEYEDEDLAIRALHVLAGRGNEGAARKIRDCLDEEDWDWIGVWAARAAGQIEGDEALNILLRLAQNDDEEARQAAAVALAGREDPRARDAVKSLLDDEDDEVRATAAGALMSFGDADAAAAVEEVFAEEDEFMEAALALGLGVPGNTAALPWLDRLLQSEDEDVRASTARALGATRDAAAVERLRKLLKDPSADVVGVAAATLARDFGDDSVTKALMTAVRDLRDFELRTEALRALISLGRKEDRNFLREIYSQEFPADWSERERQAHMMVKFWAARGLLELEAK